MGEVMITRRGTLGGDDEHFGQKRHFKKFIRSVNWIVPNDAINNEFNVICFGGGSQGSSGFLNNNRLILTPGEKIDIKVEWIASFGNYLIANGGSSYGGGSTIGRGPGSKMKAYQFGGGPGSDGGVWGGGGGSGGGSYQGNGGMYGGGGSGPYYETYVNGIGGRYGGNGSKYFYNVDYEISYIGNDYFENISNSDLISWYKKLIKKINNYTPAENGTNTIGWTNVDKDIYTGEYITGPGLAMSNVKNCVMIYPNYKYHDWLTYETITELVGGGGFGGSSIGGLTYFINQYKYYHVNDTIDDGYIFYRNSYYDGPNINISPGGGGYGGNAYGSGGGGYGKGADSYTNTYGGAGYFTPSINGEAAGWGIFGGSYHVRNGSMNNNGVCTVEYYTWE